MLAFSSFQPLALTLRVPVVARATSRAFTTAVATGPDSYSDDNCFLFETEDGRKYVCTENPGELAWFMGVDESSLVSGPKPDDMKYVGAQTVQQLRLNLLLTYAPAPRCHSLIECSEDWTHNGTPEWVCVEKESASATDAPPKFNPLHTLLGRASAVATEPSAAESDGSLAEDEDEEDACYLVETGEGTKYICTDEPAELAWFLGLDETALKRGAKPDDLNLVECAEEWSHTGTPEWVCRTQEEAGVVRPAPKFKPLRSLAKAVTRISGGAKGE